MADKMAFLWLACGLLALPFDYALAQDGDILRYVDPLIGTGLGGMAKPQEMLGNTRSYIDNRAGHVFAGATLPFGMSLHIDSKNH